MTPSARWVLLAVLLLVFTGTALVAGRQDGPLPVAGGERLGPESGEQVVDYLRRARGSLPLPGVGEVWALVQLDTYLDPAAAAALIRGIRLSSVVLRVPLPGVQTALIFRDLPGQRPAAELTGALQAAGQDRERVAAQAAPASRPAAVARAEATRLRAGCACVLAMLVHADGQQLHELIGRPGVRTVQAAPPGTSPQELAVSPLLPEQHDLVGPVSDDDRVPP
jgi:hypothetical protein